MQDLGQASLEMWRGRRGSAKSVRTAPQSRGQVSDVVRQLAAMLAASSAHPFHQDSVEGFSTGARVSLVVATGWDAIDRALAPASPRDHDSDALAHVGRGGLARGMMHEWLCGGAAAPPVSRGTDRSTVSRHRWLPPHSLFIHLAWRAIEAQEDSSSLIIWIGYRVWPQAGALRGFTTEIRENTKSALGNLEFGIWNGQHRSTHPSRRINVASIPFTPPVPSVFSMANPGTIQNPKSRIHNSSLLFRSLFIHPPDDASRLWAIDLALRSSAASVVIADGSKLKMAESRRLQLAAERGRALALLARPSWEGAELSAAATRWRVHRTPSPSSAPRWIVELLRCKQSQGRSGIQALSGARAREGAGAWEVEYASPGCLRLVADVVDRSGSPGEATSLERTG
jgi:hypothetical protein